MGTCVSSSAAASSSKKNTKGARRNSSTSNSSQKSGTQTQKSLENSKHKNPLRNPNRNSQTSQKLDTGNDRSSNRFSVKSEKSDRSERSDKMDKSSESFVKMSQQTVQSAFLDRSDSTSLCRTLQSESSFGGVTPGRSTHTSLARGRPTDYFLAAQEENPFASHCPFGNTALYICAGRAVESARPEGERLFYDPWAEAFAANFGKSFLKHLAKAAQSSLEDVSNLIGDDLLMQSLDSSEDMTQVVMLGVGGDSRSYRLPIAKNVKVFEIDLPEVMVYRKKIFSEATSVNGCEIIPISADFTNDSWKRKLLDAGFDVEEKTVWLAEGLIMYLNFGVASTLLQSLFLLSTSGSLFLGDFITTKMAKGEDEWASTKYAFSAYGPYPSLGIDVPEQYMTQCGFTVLSNEVVGLGAIDYGRAPHMLKEYLKSAERPVVNQKGKEDSVGRHMILSCFKQ